MAPVGRGVAGRRQPADRVADRARPARHAAVADHPGRDAGARDQPDVGMRWRGGDIDRVADEGHAALVGRVASMLEGLGWQVGPEVSFSVFGERGSIDLLAWHPTARILLVIEVKTSLNSVEEMLRRQDVKVRLAAGIANERFGWQPDRSRDFWSFPISTRAGALLPTTPPSRRSIACAGLPLAHGSRGRAAPSGCCSSCRSLRVGVQGAHLSRHDGCGSASRVATTTAHPPAALLVANPVHRAPDNPRRSR